MKKIFITLVLLVGLCFPSSANDLLTHTFKKDLQDEKVAPLPFLLQAIRQHPTKKRFTLRFHMEGPMDIFKTVVNVNLRTKVTYVRNSQSRVGTRLTKYTDVDEKRLRQALRYLLDSPVSPGSDGNFDLLKAVGAPTKVISDHITGRRAG